MTRARLIVAFSVLISLSPRLAFSETLFCVEQASGGLRFENGAWKGVPFKTGDTQYLIYSKPDDPQAYEVKKVGDDNIRFSCVREKLNGVLANRLVCGGLAVGMIIDFEKMRYMDVYSIGYLENDVSGANTPSMTGGKCSAINQ